MRFLSLAASLCAQDIQERFAGSLLGALWLFIWPIAQLCIYMIIFGRLMGARLGTTGMADDVYAYGFYIASGLLCWTCFAGSLGRAARSLVERRSIIRKTRVELAVFPAATCMAELLPFAAGFLLLCAARLLAGWQPSLPWLPMLLVAAYCQTILAYGLGLFFACIATFATDILEAVAIALQVAFWLTPIVYLPSILPEWLASVIWLNPMTGITGVFQHCFVLGGAPDWRAIAWALIAGHAALAAGLWTLRKWRKDLLDAL